MIRGGFPPIIDCEKVKNENKVKGFDSKNILSLDDILKQNKEIITKLNIVGTK